MAGHLAGESVRGCSATCPNRSLSEACPSRRPASARLWLLNAAWPGDFDPLWLPQHATALGHPLHSTARPSFRERVVGVKRNTSDLSATL